MDKLIYAGLTLMLLACGLDGDGSWPYIATLLGIYCIAGGMMVAGMSVRRMRKARMRQSGPVQPVHTLENDSGRDAGTPAGEIGGVERRY